MSGTNLLAMLSQAQGGTAFANIGKQFGLDERQTQMAVAALLPALSSGLKRNATQPGGLEALMGALQSGGHDRYFDQADAIAAPAARDEGNAILGHLLGSKEVSRAAAQRAAANTGLPDGMLKQMLPLVATLVMGSLSKQTQEPSIAQALMGALSGQATSPRQGPASGGLLGGILGSVLSGALGGGQARQTAQPAAQNNALGGLGALLDADGDGNAMDDIFDMLNKR